MSSVYMARWPNGDSAIVWAKTKAEALWVLDERGDPFDCEVLPLKEGGCFFELQDNGELELEGFSEYIDYCGPMETLYPVLNGHLDSVLESEGDWDGNYPADVVERERKRSLRVKYMTTAKATAAAFYGVPDSPEEIERDKRRKGILSCLLRSYKAMPRTSKANARALLEEIENDGMSIQMLLDDEQPVDWWIKYQEAIAALVPFCGYQPKSFEGSV